MRLLGEVISSPFLMTKTSAMYKKKNNRQTIDWLMEQGRKKRLPKRQAENSMVSLSTPLREGIDLTIEDTIAAAAETSDELTTYVEKILDSITEIEDEKKFWVLRLSMMSHLQLSREDVQELSRFGGHSVDNLTSRLASIMEGVEAKEEKRIKVAGKARKEYAYPYYWAPFVIMGDWR